MIVGATSGCANANTGWWKKRGSGCKLLEKKEDKDMSFKDNLKTIRKENYISQEDLAEMLGVSRQAVSKWELGDGYPEVDKLLIISKKLNVSLDRLMGDEDIKVSEEKKGTPGAIRIISPNEGVIVNASMVSRSPQFRGGKNSPKYALFSSGENSNTFWGPQNTFLAWYRDLEEITKEIEAIQRALDEGAASYTLQYSVKVKRNLFRTIEEQPQENGI